ncbi:hypothetical protein Pmar_PMAR010650 [Perkinsus marinus ATCC 50983]|uniref:Uncharacterized protein n=1 Tax=Perkinsus marinus (strain ATCC 50983 / TXsc) TaxID=423536 RepID=C5L4P0_PERM5|nr:hypothetical protein Pmar_PMAR010650 [Perkinsus marinus ATCC 50983]EER08308.1 hypothetical protein Pmar_PMAR010650 [Perkinsus marinus ATCC 50983]|eukprot:XP_002776492.1 hypothetical protein Pmar_PMAR010650 [Perkinsus marinus ATCC 50983]
MRHRKYENRRGGGRLGRHRKVTKFAEQRTPLAKDFEGRNEAPKNDDEDLLVPGGEATGAQGEVDGPTTEVVVGVAKAGEAKKLTNRERHALMKHKADLRRQKMGKGSVVEKTATKKRKNQTIDEEGEEGKGKGKKKRSEFGPDYDEDGVPNLMKPLVLPKIPRLEEALAKMAALQQHETQEGPPLLTKKGADDEAADEEEEEEAPVTVKPAFGEVIEAPPVFSKKAASVGAKAAKGGGSTGGGITGWRRQVKGKSLESLVKSVEARYE